MHRALQNAYGYVVVTNNDPYSFYVLTSVALLKLASYLVSNLQPQETSTLLILLVPKYARRYSHSSHDAA